MVGKRPGNPGFRVRFFSYDGLSRTVYTVDIVFCLPVFLFLTLVGSRITGK